MYIDEDIMDQEKNNNSLAWTHRKMFIPPHVKAINSLIFIIPIKSSGGIFQFYEYDMIFFYIV
jgi:hypothetical protein